MYYSQTWSRICILRGYQKKSCKILMRNSLNVLKKGHRGHLPKLLKRLNKEIVSDAHTHCPFPQYDIA